MGFLVKKFDLPAPEPRPSRRAAKPPRAGVEPMIVHKPICRDEAYLTVQGGLKWDREHLAEWDRELG
jgi:hypothetical protein